MVADSLRKKVKISGSFKSRGFHPSPVNLEFDFEQIARKMIFAGSNSLSSASLLKV